MTSKWQIIKNADPQRAGDAAAYNAALRAIRDFVPGMPQYGAGSKVAIFDCLNTDDSGCGPVYKWTVCKVTRSITIDELDNAKCFEELYVNESLRYFKAMGVAYAFKRRDGIPQTKVISLEEFI